MERPLLYFARSIVHNDEAALDVLQAVWLAAFRGLRRLDDPTALRSWLYRVTRGHAVDHVRRDVARASAERAHADESADIASSEDEPRFDTDDAAACIARWHARRAASRGAGPALSRSHAGRPGRGRRGLPAGDRQVANLPRQASLEGGALAPRSWPMKWNRNLTTRCSVTACSGSGSPVGLRTSITERKWKPCLPTRKNRFSERNESRP